MVSVSVPKRKASHDPPSPDRDAPALPTITSIHGLLRDNHRERLYVPPICWTARQPRLLGYYFARDKVLVEKGDPPSKLVVQNLRDQRPLYKNPIHAIAQLLRPGTLAAKQLDVANLLRPYSLFRLAPDSLPFYFGQRIAAPIPIDALNVCRPRGGRANKPVQNIHQKRLRSLEPRNPAEDPYIISILIALAQAQRQQTDTPKSTSRSFQVTVLATVGILADGVYVYTATTPTEFLDRLDAPSQPLSSCPVPVKYFRISLTPGRKALRKLHHLICSGTCTWCATEEPVGSGLAG
ncbi:hypothetical protein BO94DRAFT_589836 [Aspergillus sclerotioniger CBS 115572]|uniref:Uncharacterized protein n=1 Tax=Aspergillus sclerotioniger CBS 115572 TaxID=1450535 RepID=A0A317VFM5_9EURO|nr:hypothetical protein BO94DRAFT_589836 [Aspergillus sclerotioniger CBS 115572]PWY71768.1 hypothetical protein BO94DRAFT_589836 [Aspergillus sclerotioniger CBS 115572]